MPSKYKLCDRKGFERSKVDGTDNIWLSEDEQRTVAERLNLQGLHRDYHHIAYEKVDAWFEENPREFEKSSRHADRILTWGFEAAMRVQLMGMRMRKLVNGPVTIQDKSLEVINDERRRNRFIGIPSDSVCDVPSLPGETGCVALVPTKRVA
jgi:hypothetical protein